MIPEASFDGSRYHLALAARYLRGHGFHKIANNMYASLSREVLWTAFTPDYQPAWRLRFQFPRQPLRAVRVIQTASGAGFWPTRS